MKRFLMTLALAALVPVCAQADEVADFTADLAKIPGAFAATGLYVEQCNQRDPAGAPARRDILAGWSHGNAGPRYERLIEGLRSRMPEFTGQYETERDPLAGLIRQDFERTPQHCDDLRPSSKTTAGSRWKQS